MKLNNFGRLILGAAILCRCTLGGVVRADDPCSIKLGSIYSLTGWGAEGGLEELQGVRLAIQEINAAGGIRGCLVVHRVEDNRSELAATVAAFQKLVSVDKIAVLLGPNYAEFIKAIGDIARQRKVVVVTGTGYDPDTFDGRGNLFSLMPGHSHLVRPLTDLMVAKGLRHVAVLVSSAAYLESVAKIAIEQLRERGVVVDEIIRVNPGESNFRPIISRIAKSSVDGIFISLLEDGSGVNFLRQRDALGVKLPIFATNTIRSESIVQAHPEIAHDVMFYDNAERTSESFVARYQAAFKSNPGHYSAQAYDSVFLVKRAIETCGMSSNEIEVCLKKDKYAGVSGVIEFDDRGLVKVVGPYAKMYAYDSAGKIRELNQ